MYIKPHLNESDVFSFLLVFRGSSMIENHAHILFAAKLNKMRNLVGCCGCSSRTMSWTIVDPKSSIMNGQQSTNKARQHHKISSMA